MDLTQLPEAKYKRLDLFPAEVEERKGNKRVIVTDTHIVILGEGAEGPYLEEVTPLFDFSGSNKTKYLAVTEAENTISFKRASNCGCGSRLHGVRIYSGIPLRAIQP